ncbi:MAG: hypothetical protein NTY96_05180 [Bacteroidetes bacterium]|nr:hypothetical protein [Bacteroidota bacterium]
MNSLKKQFLFASFLLIVLLANGQKESYTLFYVEGIVQGTVNSGWEKLVKGTKIDSFRYLKIGSKASVILVNQNGIPMRLSREGIYEISKLKNLFISDALTARYFQYIWEEIEQKHHERNTANLNVVAATIRGKSEKNYPVMLCPVDSTIITGDSIHFSWTDPLKKGSFLLLVYDYNNDWKVLLKSELSANQYVIRAADLGLSPGMDYAWIVTYDTTSLSKQFCNVFSVPDSKWTTLYKNAFISMNSGIDNEIGLLRYAFFLLENRQYCEAKDTYLRSVSVARENAFVIKSKRFFSY